MVSQINVLLFYTVVVIIDIFTLNLKIVLLNIPLIDAKVAPIVFSIRTL